MDHQASAAHEHDHDHDHDDSSHVNHNISQNHHHHQNTSHTSNPHTTQQQQQQKKTRLCKYVIIHGFCKYENAGCEFSHVAAPAHATSAASQRGSAAHLKSKVIMFSLYF
jgi:hypothetical protein